MFRLGFHGGKSVLLLHGGGGGGVAGGKYGRTRDAQRETNASVLPRATGSAELSSELSSSGVVHRLHGVVNDYSRANAHTTPTTPPYNFGNTSVNVFHDRSKDAAHQTQSERILAKVMQTHARNEEMKREREVGQQRRSNAAPKYSVSQTGKSAANGKATSTSTSTSTMSKTTASTSSIPKIIKGNEEKWEYVKGKFNVDLNQTSQSLNGHLSEMVHLASKKGEAAMKHPLANAKRSLVSPSTPNAMRGGSKNHRRDDDDDDDDNNNKNGAAGSNNNNMNNNGRQRVLFALSALLAAIGVALFIFTFGWNVGQPVNTAYVEMSARRTRSVDYDEEDASEEEDDDDTEDIDSFLNNPAREGVADDYFDDDDD